jgi:hypothetical protein
MNRSNDHQNPYRQKNTSAGQLVCPHCQTAFPITWRRYWAAPWGNYRCPACRQLSYATANFWWVLPITIVITIVAMMTGGILGIGFAAYVFHTRWMGLFFLLIGGLAVGLVVVLPLDKWMDGHLRHLKIRSS